MGGESRIERGRRKREKTKGKARAIGDREKIFRNIKEERRRTNRK